MPFSHAMKEGVTTAINLSVSLSFEYVIGSATTTCDMNNHCTNHD